ncbi:PLU-1-like domain-containing protein [Neurospora intermedia]|uniref:PLU-1-like domain-containing protein n=1 Tax=Neurospora intermedia TaxID=5142 RepID=A0ABR3CZ99_NEUIN
MVSTPSGGGSVAVAAAGTSSNNASARASPTVTSHSSNGKSKAAPVNSNGYHPPKSQIPLSFMKSEPLDLNSVERRGQPTACKEPSKKKNRPHGLEEAPSYCPTEEEWKEPFEYIRKITPEASKFGICKIIPPESWNPDFAIDTERFHFRTRKQELNSIEGSSRANINYIDALQKFHRQHGNNLTRLPYVDKKPLDLFRLKKAVEARGGFDKVCKLKKWAEIGRDLGYSGKIMSSLSTSLKNSYQKWLCPYEDYLRVAKPGVHQQLELEYGGPLTPSPAPSPMKRSNAQTPSDLRGESPSRHPTEAAVNGHAKDSDRDVTMTDAPSIPAPPVKSGFTAINTGGFTAINSGFTSINRPLAPASEAITPLSSAKNTPEVRPSAAGSSSLKRQLSFDSTSDSAKKESSVDKDDGEAGSRRSKRLKKDSVPTVAGSHMSLFRPSAPRIPREDSSSGENCEQCGKGSEGGSCMLVCESCDNHYHGSCLDPPLKTKPENEWNCPRCLVGDGQFGFEEGGLYSLKQFQEKAADFKQGYFENKMPFDAVLNCHRPVTEDDVEREFWRLVADLEETVEVEYGADIHCTTHGSGFPTVEKNPNNPYSTDPWNLNLLPLHPESLFRYIKTDISGMTVPWVYVGMIFSTFCWHNEDHYAYSANYQHFGATKTWYGIPGEDAEKFEAAMREAVPELFETQPDLLFQLVTLLTPEQLKKAGVRVYALDQRAGQFVITFPKAYHAGFNHGFNFNEAVNFAPSDWEPFGHAGVERLQTFRRQPCFSHDELLWAAADGITGTGLTIQTAKWLAPALDRIHQREMVQRREFIGKHDFIATHLDAKHPSPHHLCVFNGETNEKCPIQFAINDVDVPEDEYACFYCKAYTYLSRFVCLKTGMVLCLLHAGSHKCCDAQESDRFLGKEHALYYRKSDEVMASTLKRVTDKASVPETWEEKYQRLLDDEAKPSLKALRNLLSEGEKIPYELPSLSTLKLFVDRCNHWVEEATNYTIRKQQNRRKSEKAWPVGVRKSVGNAEHDQKEREMRNVANIHRLLDEAEMIGFDCPEIQQLRERAEAIKAFQETAKKVLDLPRDLQPIGSIEELLEEGQNFNVDIPEVEKLYSALERLRWDEKARESRSKFMTLDEAQELVDEGKRLGIQIYEDNIKYLEEKLEKGREWEKKARELINADVVNYSQLDSLSVQAQHANLPISKGTLDMVDAILYKQREAQRQIIDLNKRSADPDYTQRPKYNEVAEVMRKVEELQAKPPGTLDLEKEQKRHEDWMRKGKKLFGKSNAPLHILKSHMDYVLDRNKWCFNTVEDTPRSPAEPASREPSVDGEHDSSDNEDENGSRQVFCICRRVEAGMMIECEQCHEWYHGKCLKIARGKVKEDDKYTCPICDWRVKIPRDASRPKLEDLIAWYEEIPNLPFRPEEEGVLKDIIDMAERFRKHISPLCSGFSTAADAENQRFYLRKIEGAEILLAYETNYLRQELHKWNPVAPEPPPILEQSKSTRKPRPTKLQKLLQQHGVQDPDDLPEDVRGRANSLKRKAQNAEAHAGGLGTGPGMHPYGPGHTYFSRQSSAQPQTPGLPMTNSSHAHPSRGPDSVSPSNTLNGRTGSLSHHSPLHHSRYFNGDNSTSGQALSIEDRILRDHHDNDDHADANRAKFRDSIWGSASPATKRSSASALVTENDPMGIGPPADEGVADNHMFIDLVHDDDEEDERRGAAAAASADLVADHHHHRHEMETDHDHLLEV